MYILGLLGIFHATFLIVCRHTRSLRCSGTQTSSRTRRTKRWRRRNSWTLPPPRRFLLIKVSCCCWCVEYSTFIYVCNGMRYKIWGEGMLVVWAPIPDLRLFSLKLAWIKLALIHWKVGRIYLQFESLTIRKIKIPIFRAKRPKSAENYSGLL